jgi:hypothetical protein
LVQSFVAAIAAKAMLRPEIPENSTKPANEVSHLFLFIMISVTRRDNLIGPIPAPMVLDRSRFRHLE